MRIEDKQLLVTALGNTAQPPRLGLGTVLSWRNEAVDLLAFNRLSARGLAPLWPAEDAALPGRTRQAAALDTLNGAAVRAVLAAFHREGIPALLLKGWALAHTHYTQPWLRPRSDLDVLVPMADLDRTAAILGPLGFASAREITDPLITTQRHLNRGEPSPLALDVHGTLANPAVLRQLPAWEELRTRAVQVPALGPYAFALSPPDALLHALVHRVAHHNSSADPLWLYDVHLLAGGLDAEGWETLIVGARRAAVCAIAADGLQVTVRTFSTPIPAFVLRALRSAPPEPSAALLGGHLTEWRLQWINFRSLDGLATRVRFVRAHLFPPVHIVEGSASPGRRPLAYGRRLVRGILKWLAPIDNGR